MASKDYDTFEAVQSRLDEIVEAVGDESLPLDDALALYEEAVNLGLRGSDLLEENIEAFDAQQQADAADGAEGSAASAEAASDAAEGPDGGAAVQYVDDEEPQAVADGIR